LATRRRIEEYVRPLAAGLDGAAQFGDTRRIVSACDRIAAGRTDLDRDLLYLLAVFSGQERWVSRMGHRSRTEMFLASLGIPGPKIRALFRGLTRLEADPATPEEEVAHDAVRLDELGARGISRRLQEGRREGATFLEMAAAIEEAARAPLRTEAGEVLARERRATMVEFARRLAEEENEFD
jgi:ADP-ribose pyrophosphatase YjhB (NUDIX family)